MAAEESELVRAVKQMIELRSSKSPQVTLFGKNISDAQAAAVDPSSKKSCPVSESIEKLMAERARAEHLTELYKQHLKRRGRSITENSAVEVATLPLLSTMERDSKRQNTADSDVSSKMPGSERSSSAELTIFYKGMVYRFDDVPVDKAKAMLVLAGAAASGVNHESVDDLPQARKASLQRFLEKRKERLSPPSSKRTKPSHSRSCSKASTSAAGPVNIAVT